MDEEAVGFLERKRGVEVVLDSGRDDEIILKQRRRW